MPNDSDVVALLVREAVRLLIDLGSAALESMVDVGTQRAREWIARLRMWAREQAQLETVDRPQLEAADRAQIEAAGTPRLGDAPDARR